MRWRSGLGADVTATIVRLAAQTLEVDGVAPLSGHILETLGDDEYLLAHSGADLAGVAVAHLSDPAEVFIAPPNRRRGLGRALVTSALARSGALWAHGDLPVARALAVKLGLVRTRELLQMRRPLTPQWAAERQAAAGLPPGVRLRTFVPGQDEEQFLAVNGRAFDWHPEQGRLDLAGLRAEMAQPWFDPAGFFLAVDLDDTVLGFHWTKVHTEGPEPLGEVYVIAVDPLATVAEAPVRGLGSSLTAAGLAYLAVKGLRTVLLYVEGDNEKALRLYRRLGFTTFSTDVVYRAAE